MPKVLICRGRGRESTGAEGNNRARASSRIQDTKAAGILDTWTSRRGESGGRGSWRIHSRHHARRFQGENRQSVQLTTSTSAGEKDWKTGLGESTPDRVNPPIRERGERPKVEVNIKSHAAT